MITKIRIRKFRQIEDETLELGQAVVLIGPNNGGKSTLLQAFSLFATAVKFWGAEKINKKSSAQKRTGVAITLDNLLNISISDFRELWKDLNVREGKKNATGKTIAKNIRIEIFAEGFTHQQRWETGFEFDYGRDNLMYVRIARNEAGEMYDFPDILLEERIGFLPSVSGLKPTEDKLETGSILRHIGNGNTADVLRNICYLLYSQEEKKGWNTLIQEMERLFRISLNAPQYSPASGLLKMTYNEGPKKNLDLASLGSGSKQAILLFAYMLAFPNTIHLLDEPDAHLEIIRQSNIYDTLSDWAKRHNNQLIIASHSESVMNRAFGKDQVFSSIFGQFSEVNHKTYISSVLKQYGYEEFLIARQRPCIFYFEGSTDLDFIKAFCKKLEYKEIYNFLEKEVYPYPVGGDVAQVRKHFAALKEFIPELKGYALFDNLRKQTERPPEGLKIKQWSRNEIENYLPIPQTLYAYAESKPEFGPIFMEKFRQIIQENITPAALRDLNNAFWVETKISDSFLTPVFEQILDILGIPRGFMDKSKFYQLVEFVNPDLLNPELPHTIQELYQWLKKDPEIK